LKKEITTESLGHLRGVTTHQYVMPTRNLILLLRNASRRVIKPGLLFVSFNLFPLAFYPHRNQNLTSVPLRKCGGTYQNYVSLEW